MENLVVRDARIIFRNFRGEERRFNRAGDRNFCLVLDEENALRLKEDGWNVKMRDPVEDGEPSTGILRVSVSFANPRYLPKVVLVSSKGKTTLDEDMLDVLDSAAITKVDCCIRPREWETNGSSGIKAYCKTLYVTIEDDEFEDDYEDVPERY